VGGVADAVIDNETGLLVETSVDAMAGAIAKLAMDGIKRTSLGKRAWTRAYTMNWERCAAATYYLSLPAHHASLGATAEGEFSRFAVGAP